MTDTAELIARLTSTPEKHEARMVLWDRVRALVRDGDTGSGPRDIIESVIDGLEEDAQEAADALSSLVRERDAKHAMFLYEADKHSEWLEKFMAMKARATAAESDAARMREALEECDRTIDFVTRWAWRENAKLTDEERLSAIKYHPKIKPSLCYLDASGNATITQEGRDLLSEVARNALGGKDE